MKFPSVLLLTKAVKGENKTPKFNTIQTPRTNDELLR